MHYSKLRKCWDCVFRGDNEEIQTAGTDSIYYEPALTEGVIETLSQSFSGIGRYGTNN